MACYPGSLPGEGNLAVKQSKADLRFHCGFISNSPQKYKFNKKNSSLCLTFRPQIYVLAKPSKITAELVTKQSSQTTRQSLQPIKLIETKLRGLKQQYSKITRD